MSRNHNAETVIRLQNLSKRFRSFTAVDDITLEIRKGEIMGFLGPNGAGKSTTMKMMANLIAPTSGKIFVNVAGEMRELTMQNKDVLLDRMGFLIENPAFYDDVTPRQVLSYFARLRGYPHEATNQRVEHLVARLQMTAWIDKPIRTFSKGMRQKIGILAAIAHDPEIIVLDEPQTGLDPLARKEMRVFFQELKNEGKTIFLSSHILYDISEVADRVAIISRGRLIACDEIDTLEMMAKRSIMRLGVMEQDLVDGVDAFIAKIETPLKGLTGLSNGDFAVRYNQDARLFEIMFDGTESAQREIHKTLVMMNVGITEFSVPKANLLEDLYITLMQDAADPSCASDTRVKEAA